MELIKPGRTFDFMSRRRYFIGVSLILMALSVVSLFWPGLRLGTDFKGGTEVEIAFTAPVEAADVRAAVQASGFQAPEIVSVDDATNPNRFLIRVHEVSALSPAQQAAIRDRLCFAEEGAAAPEDRCPPEVRAVEVKFSPGGEKISARYEVEPDLPAILARLSGVEGVALRPGDKAATMLSERDHKVEIYLMSRGDQMIEGLRQQLGADVVPAQALRVEWIGPKAGAQLRDAAIKSVVIALVFIMAYVAIRFDLRFVAGGILALVHDVLIAMGAMAITQREISLPTVAAMLTIVGYSINDTVVVYDRIRENLGRHRDLSFAQIINLSISEMFGRTLITSGVTALSVLTFFIWGTGVIQDFAFALLVGMAAGVYSSIYVAAPLTEWIDKRFFRGTTAQARKPPRKRLERRPDAVV